jgi:uncharacterized protein (TIGR02246 family)
MNAAVLPEERFQPDLPWWEHVFAIVDTGDAARFVGLLTPDASFRFGNGPEIFGIDAIRTAAAAFFAAIAASQHQIFNYWNGPAVGPATAACEGVVAYTRQDGSMVNIPFANVFELRDRQIASYRIYIDNSPLFQSSS